MNDRDGWCEKPREIYAIAWLDGDNLCMYVYAMYVYAIRPIDGTLAGVTNLGQREPGSNINERVHHIPQIPGSKPHHQMQFSVIFRTHSVYVYVCTRVNCVHMWERCFCVSE